jgi:hypothetical protein
MKAKIGSLADPSGLRTQSERKILKHPLVAHFSGSVVTEMAAFIAVRYARPRVWWVVVEIVTYGSAECAINSSTPYISPSMDDVILAL